MTIIYLLLFFISLLLPIYSLINKKYKEEIWLFIFYVSVSIVNLGYCLISISSTLDFALLANKISYLGNIIVIMSMLFLITKISGYDLSKRLKIITVIVGILIFSLVGTSGYLDWYYKSVDLVNINGSYKLVKEYGVLHPVYLIYVIINFILMIVFISFSTKKKKDKSFKLLGLMITIICCNIGMWIIEKNVPFDFEFLAVSYILSEFVFFFIYWILEDYVHIDEISKTKTMLDTRLCIDVLSMSNEEKVKVILNSVKEDISISNREMDILKLLLENKKRKDIATELNLSENTIKTYTRSLYNKLEINNREELFLILDNNKQSLDL